jgi:hypothetical protein
MHANSWYLMGGFQARRACVPVPASLPAGYFVDACTRNAERRVNVAKQDQIVSEQKPSKTCYQGRGLVTYEHARPTLEKCPISDRSLSYSSGFDRHDQEAASRTDLPAHLAGTWHQMFHHLFHKTYHRRLHD